MNPLCSLPQLKPRHDYSTMGVRRAGLVAQRTKLLLAGTNITYYFFTAPSNWVGSSQDVAVVRQAIQDWINIGINLTFEEVDAPEDAMVRMGFQQGGGSWSYVGRDGIDFVKDPTQRTMNFGWNLTTEFGKTTAQHEWGHALGMEHSHQNPLAGLIFDEETVYRTFAQAPNFWSREDTYYNVLRKIEVNEAAGSSWDRDSVMQYAFQAGLIISPERYQNEALNPAPGISEQDKITIRELYPTLLPVAYSDLKVCESQKLEISEGQQIQFLFRPKQDRRYTFRTFGISDTLLVLYRLEDGKELYITGDDDSGYDFNARILEFLEADVDYILKIRLYHEDIAGQTCVMVY